MRKIFFLLVLNLLILSCNSGGHYHDGKYQTKIAFVEVNYQINSSEITIDNSITGIFKLSCTQYPDRIGYTESNGTTHILTALENGDLKFSDQIIMRKVESDNDSRTTEK